MGLVNDNIKGVCFLVGIYPLKILSWYQLKVTYLPTKKVATKSNMSTN